VLRVDGATGRLEARAATDGWDLLGVFGEKAWFANVSGEPSLLTRRPNRLLALRVADLSVAATTSDLIAAHAELAALADPATQGCFDAASGAYRFTDRDGTYRAFDLAREQVVAVDGVACAPPASGSEPFLWWTERASIRAEPEPGSARVRVIGPEGAPLDLGGLAVQFVNLKPQDGAVGLVRRVDAAGDAELVWFEPLSGTVRWTAALPGITDVNLSRAVVAGGRMVVADHDTVVALDARTGAVLWQRGPWSTGLW
jgi:hypothetical protein